MAPSRMAGGLAQSSSSSGIFFQGDPHSQVIFNSHLASSFNNSSNPIPQMNNSVLNGVANSGPSVAASSLVTDANSALSGGPHLQRSASINTESYMRLPASPMSFTSNNISISGSSIVDGSSVAQQQGASSATFVPDTNNLSQVQKKPRLDIKQEDILQQQVFQQLLQRQDSIQLQSRSPQFQNLLHQQRLRQQQQILQSMPPLQRAQLHQQQQQMQLRQQMQQAAIQPVAGVKRPFDGGGICARRLMQYLYHQRQRPAENSIAYWRKFVAEYYSPRAKKRWCLSLYDNVGHHALGVFPQTAMEAWQCDICGSKSGRGFEATFEVLPRLDEIKFGSGVIDELLFLDLPRECRFPSGAMMLEYGKAVQESVYEQLRVVREGQLRIIFTHDLKILSWEFCARRHEELLPRRVVAPQVNQLVQVAQKCQNTIAESGSDGVSQQDLQTNSNMVLTAGRQLAKTLELQSLNDLGFSKRYVRCLQISEVVNSMKDLIDFCGEQEFGPIEGLKSYPRQTKLQMQEIEQLANVTDRNTLNKLMALHPGITNRTALTGLTNYQNLLIRQNSINSNSSSQQLQQQEPSPGPQNTPAGTVQQQMIQQLLQEMSNNGGRNGTGGGPTSVAAAVSAPNLGGPAPSRSNSFKNPSNSDTTTGFNQKVTELQDEMVPDMGHEFSENGFFNSDLDETMSYGWKA